MPCKFCMCVLMACLPMMCARAGLGRQQITTNASARVQTAKGSGGLMLATDVTSRDGPADDETFAVGARADAPIGLLSEISQNNQDLNSEQEGNSAQNSIQESPEERRERMNLPYKLAPERLSVQAPAEDVPLGNPVDITVTFAPGNVVDLRTGQSSLGQGVYQGGGLARIVRDEGYKKTIEIIPAQLGPVDLYVAAAYSDNAVATQTIRLNVVPSAKGLKSFVIDGGNIGVPLVLEDKKEDRQVRIFPSVFYSGLEYPISLNGCEQIKFSVEQPDDEGDPIVEIDKNCMVHALREGKAYIVGDFAGKKDRLSVTVFSKEDAPSWYRRAIP